MHPSAGFSFKTNLVKIFQYRLRGFRLGGSGFAVSCLVCHPTAHFGDFSNAWKASSVSYG